MNLLHKVLFAASLVFSLSPAHAQSDAARELKQIQADREKNLKETTEPITQRYREEVRAASEKINQRDQASLEKLLDRATRDADFDTALKIKAAIDTLPQVVAKQIAGVWALRANTGYGATVTFQSNGTGTHSGYGKFQWRIDGTTLYLGPSDGADRFQLPIVEGKLKGANGLGNELTMTRK